MQERLFTVEEARALLPTVRPLVEAMRQTKIAFDAARSGRPLPGTTTGTNGNGSGKHGSPLERMADELTRLVEQIREMGVQVKDLNLGLIDFPSLREGEPILLCWKVGEDDIAWWHPADTGFADRRPL